MKIQSQPAASILQRHLPKAPPQQKDEVRLSRPTQTSPILRHALIGGAVAATGTAGLMLAGHSLQSALHIVGPLAGLGAMGYLLIRTMEPDVPLQPEVLASLTIGRFSDNDKQAVQKALNALGPDNVRRLQEGGVKLVVDSDKVPGKAGACYYPGQRLACFRRGSVEKHYVIHELGHALDNLAAKQPQSPVIGGANAPPPKTPHYRSQHDSKLQSNYQHYMEGRPRWSEYARTNHQEYLAEGVTYYLDSEQKKAELQSKDPQHYQYIENFLHDPAKEEHSNSRNSGG